MNSRPQKLTRNSTNTLKTHFSTPIWHTFTATQTFHALRAMFCVQQATHVHLDTSAVKNRRVSGLLYAYDHQNCIRIDEVAHYKILAVVSWATGFEWINKKCDLMSRDVQVCSRWPLKKSGGRCGYLKMFLTVAISHLKFAVYLKFLFRVLAYN